jgi:hypothetical protein
MHATVISITGPLCSPRLMGRKALIWSAFRPINIVSLAGMSDGWRLVLYLHRGFREEIRGFGALPGSDVTLP